MTHSVRETLRLKIKSTFFSKHYIQLYSFYSNKKSNSNVEVICINMNVEVICIKFVNICIYILFNINTPFLSLTND